MTHEQQSGFMVFLLGSNLPTNIKIAACKKSSLSWLDPNVHSRLLPLLPVHEHARYSMLPWTEPKSHLRSTDVAHDNEAIATLYCPNMIPAFNLLLQPNDWLKRAVVCNAVDFAHPKNVMPCRLPIDDLVL